MMKDHPLLNLSNHALKITRIIYSLIQNEKNVIHIAFPIYFDRNQHNARSHSTNNELHIKTSLLMHYP